MNKLIDLHTHTHYSDGDYSPKKILEIAKENGVATLAITDHDTIKGAIEAARENDTGIELISGVEISAKDKENNNPKARLHILGYDIDLNNVALNKNMDQLFQNSRDVFLLYIAKLKTKYHIEFPSEEIETLLSKNGDINRVHIAALLVKYGFCKEKQEAFVRYLNEIRQSISSFREFTYANDAIKMIKDAGGIATYAHPGSSLLDYQELKKQIIRLKEMGLEGLEVFHINNNEALTKFLLETCDELNLLYSGGSDYHGPSVKPFVNIGTGSTKENESSIKIKHLTLLDTIRKRK